MDDGDSFLADIEIDIFEAAITWRVHSVDAEVVEFALQPFFFGCFLAVFEPQQSVAPTYMLRIELHTMGVDRIHIDREQLEYSGYLAGLLEMLVAQLVQCKFADIELSC